MSKSETKLKVTSIFLSVNGECCKAGQGSWTVFIRFFGCTAKCSYCDSKYSHDEKTKYKEMHPADIFAEVVKLDPGCKRVTITGGEPLEQNVEELIELISLLTKINYEVSIETNGLQMPIVKSLIQQFPRSHKQGTLSFVSDIKLPSSGRPWGIIQNKLSMQDRLGIPGNYVNEFLILGEHDSVKFVIKDEHDFALASGIVKSLPLYVKKYFSPCGIKTPGLLFEWMKEAECAKLNIGYNLQIHKVIFPGDWRDEEK